MHKFSIVIRISFLHYQIFNILISDGMQFFKNFSAIRFC
jgi:hypothetical protein